MSAMGAAPAVGIRRRVLKGLAWTGGSQIVMQVIRMIAAVVLARLLAPEDYGLAAIAIVVASLVLVFSDLGLGAAVVQRKELSEDDRCTAFWMAIAAGAIFTSACFLLSGQIASFYGDERVSSLCAVLSISFLITSAATTHEALLVRSMEFGKLERRLMVATLAGAAVGIGVGLATRDAWAIIAQELAYALTSSTLLWAFSPWRPGLRFSWKSLRALGGFSIYLVGHRLLYYFHRNADNILIGRYIGAAALGAYTIAYNIMLVPFSRVAGPIQRVLGPAFARLQDEPARIADIWVRVVRLVGMISIPALLGLIVVAPDFVVVVLGEKWSPAIPLIQVLAWVGLIQSLQSISTDVLQARGNTRTIFRFSLFFCTAHVIAFVIGLQWGVVGVAVAYAISSTLVEPVYTVLTARSIQISAWRVLGAVRGVFEAAAGMTACVLVARTALVGWGVPAGARLAICVVIGAAVFAAASAWRAPEAWADLRQILRDALGRRLSRRGAARGGGLAEGQVA
jgi:O-antigen/teichoic acid export membrane protein